MRNFARANRNELPRSKLRGIESRSCAHSHSRHPRMLLSGVQIRIRLDSRLKRVGMTDFYLTQQAAGNEPLAIQAELRLRIGAQVGHVQPTSEPLRENLLIFPGVLNNWQETSKRSQRIIIVNNYRSDCCVITGYSARCRATSAR